MQLNSASGKNDVLDKRVQFLHKMYAFPVIVDVHGTTQLWLMQLKLHSLSIVSMIPMLLVPMHYTT